MIEIQRIKEKKEEVLLGLSKRNIDATQEVEQIIKLDHDWRLKKTQLQDVETELNSISKQIGILFSSGKQEEAKLLKSKTGALKATLQELKIEEDGLEKKIQTILFTLPNVCTQEVPAGKDEMANEILEEF